MTNQPTNETPAQLTEAQVAALLAQLQKADAMTLLKVSQQLSGVVKEKVSGQADANGRELTDGARLMREAVAKLAPTLQKAAEAYASELSQAESLARAWLRFAGPRWAELQASGVEIPMDSKVRFDVERPKGIPTTIEAQDYQRIKFGGSLPKPGQKVEFEAFKRQIGA